jgi:N-acetylmuramoyl-L-alanine amidase
MRLMRNPRAIASFCMSPSFQALIKIRPLNSFSAIFIFIFFFGITSLTPEARGSVKFNGVDYLSLKNVAANLGMKRSWVKNKETMTLTSKWSRLDFAVDKRDIKLNGIRVFLGYPVALNGLDLYISELDYKHNVLPILTPQKIPNVPKLYHIVIDPGHGGKDPGSVNSALKMTEKTLAFDIAIRLKKILESQNYRVTLTRKSDKFIELEKRPAIANALKADLFISIHLNSHKSKKVQGLETYVITPHNQPSAGRKILRTSDRRYYPGNRQDAWNALVGYYVQRELIRELPSPDRGLKRARFMQLKELNCPGLLVEGGFISNAIESRNLGAAAYRQRIAQAVADGLFRYQKTLNRLRQNVG